jgi:hypothetical protein
MKIYLLANRNFWGRQSLQPGSNQNSQNPKIFEEAVTVVFSKGNSRLRQTMALAGGGRIELMSLLILLIHANSSSTCL